MDPNTTPLKDQYPSNIAKIATTKNLQSLTKEKIMKEKGVLTNVNAKGFGGLTPRSASMVAPQGKNNRKQLIKKARVRKYFTTIMRMLNKILGAQHQCRKVSDMT